MASGLTASPGNAGSGKPSTSAVEPTRLIDQRLRSTRGQVKWTELLTALLMFAAGALVYLFAFVVVDHWVAQGGVGFWGRLLFLLAFLVAGGLFLIRAIGPLMTRRINTLYAAATIERGQPDLKNSLVNFLLLRSRPQDVNPAVFKAIQRRAARDLENIHPEAVIDRTHLIKAGYALMAVVAICCVYTLLSSKSPFRSVGRMFAPWADVEAPTRVGFSDVRPGSRQAFHDEFIDVSVLVQGVDDDEPVTLYYSTADGQEVDVPLVMTRPEDSFRHQVTLPQGTSGIQQDIQYHIVAGDARTHTYAIKVASAPAIIVDRVDFEYPDYTGLADRGQRGQGDIVALEGTRVTLSARANQGIAEAFVDFDCDGSRDLDMNVDGKLASVSFTLRLDENQSSEYESYEILFTNEQGHENPRPARHHIEVTADAAPEIEIIQPTVDEIEVPINASVDVELKARDRDFRLSNVTIHARRQGQVLLRQELLKDSHDGEFTGTYRLRPSELGLKLGDEVVFWADARDNKHPNPNRTQTLEYRLRVVAPVDQPPEEQQPRDDQKGGQEKQPDQETQDGDTDGEQVPMQEPDDQTADGDGDSKQEDAGEEDQARESETSERIDPEAQPGEAFEEILKHLEEQDSQQNPGQENPNEPTPNQDQPPSSEGEQPQDDGMDQPQPGADGQGSEEQSPSQPSAEESPAGEQQGAGGDQQSGGAEPSPEGGGQQDSGSEQQPGSAGGQQPSSDSSEGSNKQQSTGSGQSESQPGGDGEMKANDSSGSSEGTQSRGGQTDGDQGQQSPAAKDGTPRRDRPGSSGDPEREDSGRADRETSGDGGQTAGQGTQGSDQKPNESEKQSDPRGGNPENQQGTGGDGEKSDDDAGTGSKQGHQKPKDKQQQQAPNDAEAGKGEASPQSESSHESNSQGETSGDRSGGGEEGAGQSADSEGTGSAGSNSAAEEGAGQSEGAGKGPTSDQAGDKSASDSASDQPGEKTSGKGDSGEGGQSSGGQPRNSSGDPGSNESSGGQPPAGESSSQPSGDSQAGSPSGGGTSGGTEGDAPGQGAGSQPGHQNNGPAGNEDQQSVDDANLEYASKATDLALEYLRDQLQRDDPDQALLDRLQWTREDMERFVSYWEKFKRGGQREEASDELRDALQGLGLRPKGTRINSGDSASDQFRQLRESRRTSPPPEYAEQFRRFTEGTARRRVKSND